MDKKKVVDELNTDVLPFLQHHCDIQCDREKRWISKMIITVHNAIALLKEQPEIIRCKDCKHRDPEDGKCDSGHGIQWQLPRQDDWFCADAEPKNDLTQGRSVK